MTPRTISMPPLYGIVDAAFFATLEELVVFARELTNGGCSLLQYRNKKGSARVIQDQSRELRRFINAKWIMNDRADLCVACEFDGLHLGQDDLRPVYARCILGPEPWLGISTHNPEQLEEADASGADYLAVGPVFATSTKENPDPVIGLQGVRQARALTRKPLVAIGGITRANAASVIQAGADSVAVISDLLREPRKSAEEFFRVLR
ncbi:MAG TPA: thiamine phosphate synthase [Candidatus Dormibacteraeota bacterium]|nr:thiamine phosphate synthase [Candidatus Dormibacteraeota bacterium]